MIRKLSQELKKLADPEKARMLSRFFKTGKGEYGEGDVFLGISVPEQRKIAKKHVQTTALSQISALLSSRVHEQRLVALLMLVEKYGLSNEAGKKAIVKLYLKNTKHINNWDLVDLSAGKILGDYLVDKDKSLLYVLARSENLWERRIAIIATSSFIRENRFEDTLSISKLLLKDSHDLIHKAVGWMLREVGKRNIKALERFLDSHYEEMPRTMLRYAVERLDKEKRLHYLE